MISLFYIVNVRPQMVVFGSEQGLSNFKTDGVAVTAIAGIAGYVEDFKRAKTPLWAKRFCLWMDISSKDSGPKLPAGYVLSFAFTQVRFFDLGFLHKLIGRTGHNNHPFFQYKCHVSNVEGMPYILFNNQN